MGGHVFVTQGDLTRFWCDAWLMPTGPRVMIVHYWFREDVLEVLGDRLIPAFPGHFHPLHDIPKAYKAGALRTYKFPDYPGTDSGPQPWLTNVGGNHDRDPEWYMEAVRQFVAAAAAEGVRVTRRVKPLLGIPLIGTGAGGQHRQKAEMTRALLPELNKLADEHDCDIALVTFDDEAFAAAQAERRNLSTRWDDLNRDQRKRAQFLAERALQNELVLFMGAGVSMAAGLPSWGQLLRGLAEVAEFSEEELAELSKLPPGDQALIVQRELGGRERLVEEIRRRLDTTFCALSHTYCARLPTDTAVTLNYDRLYEQASESQGTPVALIPERPERPHGCSLLKLHGCIDHDEDIVLTREDYLRFRDRRSALAGFVQALLLTHHTLFVGFGLADDNFHQILDDVRKILGNPDDTVHSVGTVLTLWPEPLRDRLWDKDLRILPMFDTKAETAEAARRLEIFLDHLLFLTSQRPQYLLDETYSGLLTFEEREFRDDVRRLAAEHTDLNPAIHNELLRFIERLGG